MTDERELLGIIKELVIGRKYRVRVHAIRHMIEEGFDEGNIAEAITGKSRIIESYPDDFRCLILGGFHFTQAIVSPLHVVCDYSRNDLVDIVTAYIPQNPWWVSPTKRG